MATIGTGTRQVIYNAPTDEHALLRAEAVKLGFRSTGACLRHLVQKGLEAVDSDAARELRKVRTKYYGSMFLLIVFCSLCLPHDPVLRVARGRVRIRRDACQ